MHGMDPTRLAMPHLAKDQLNLLESVEAAHADHSFNDQVSSILGITRPSTRMDSQAKYACLARGDGGIYLRIPSQKGYKEKIWVSSERDFFMFSIVNIKTRITLLALF
jgi:3'(2'), 5'-bisphosphate nucleotidase